MEVESDGTTKFEFKNEFATFVKEFIFYNALKHDVLRCIHIVSLRSVSTGTYSCDYIPDLVDAFLLFLD